MKRIFSVGTKIALTALLLNGSSQKAEGFALTDGVFSLFLECNNDGTALVFEGVDGWQYSQDATGDMTDGSDYDLTGMGVFQNGNEMFVAIGGNMPLLGTGLDRNLDRIFPGDLFFTPAGQNFQQSMEAGNLHAIHFSGSSDSGADSGLGVYKNVAAKGVGMQNFGHRTLDNYEALVDSSENNFYGNLGADNPYFNGNGTGYNVIAGGDRVANDGFQMLTATELTAEGFNQNSLGGTEFFGFKFNLDAIVPPEPPKDIETLKGIAQGYGFDWDGQPWDGELESFEGTIGNLQTEIDNIQAEVEGYQNKIHAHQAQIDTYNERQAAAEAEVKRLQKQEINPLNGKNNNAAKKVPGGEANSEIKKELGKRNKIVNNLNGVEETISENPQKILDAEGKRDQIETKLDNVPSKEEALELAKPKASGTIKDAYVEVAQLKSQKEAWEEYKENNNWENLSLQQKLELQNNYDGGWIELRNDGSLAKQEQELIFFNDLIADFEVGVEQERQGNINKLEKQFNNQKNKIDTLKQDLADAKIDKPNLEQELDNFYNQHFDTSNKNSLQQKLEKIRDNSEKQWNKLNNKNNLTPAQEEEMAFYEQNINETQNLLNEIDATSIDTLTSSLDNLLNGANEYFNALKVEASNSDRPDGLDSNNFKTYTAEDLTVKIPVYNEDGEIVNYTTHTFNGVQVGDPKTIGSEYQRREFEAGLFKVARNQREQVKIQNKALSQSEVALRQEDIESRNAAESQKAQVVKQQDKQIDLQNDLLRDIEGTLVPFIDEAIAAEKRENMQERLAAAEVENQREQELEEEFGVRTDRNIGGVPTTPEEALARLNETPSVRVPEPSSLMGLFTVIGAGLAALGRRQRR
ncbi:MAG: PEP-CTERM sorting domain-containing protein [Okeania sp. SIO2F4]|uniref:XDD3 family exosortase-dependent surface protein n=1 Tax=Okeania sp. SIO2F4 TaxID=2607790 RepID=UPI00142B28D9|nr:XDD3 family exosortase-dependent surface protein [Okeania sp. SIO2F4]NES07597.1 PEP-CTERM sorting domain-containing protein [Okeania sp. SIO2F4]